MSLLTICQAAGERVGVTVGSQVIGSTNRHAKTMLALSNQEGKELVRRRDWEALTKENSWSATATEEQSGEIPDGFDRIIPGTFWNRTEDRPVAGPVSPQRWQLLKSGLLTTPWDTYRIRGSAILMNPTPTAGDTLVYEYVTKYWCGGASDTAPTQVEWLADDDIAFVDEEIVTLGVVWRWKKSRGLAYSDDYRLYEDQLNRTMVSDGGAADLDMGTGDDGSAIFDPYVSDGGWSIS